MVGFYEPTWFGLKMQVTVPAGKKGGEVMPLHTPSGEVLEVVIPVGLGAGQSFQFDLLQTNIFTMNQSELEGATEKLSNMLECEEILKWCNEGDRVEMINQTNQVSTYTQSHTTT